MLLTRRHIVWARVRSLRLLGGVCVCASEHSERNAEENERPRVDN